MCMRRYVIKHKQLINRGTDEDVLQDLADFITQRPNQCGIIYARLRCGPAILAHASSLAAMHRRLP